MSVESQLLLYVLCGITLMAFMHTVYLIKGKEWGEKVKDDPKYRPYFLLLGILVITFLPVVFSVSLLFPEKKSAQ